MDVIQGESAGEDQAQSSETCQNVPPASRGGANKGGGEEARDTEENQRRGHDGALRRKWSTKPRGQVRCGQWLCLDQATTGLDKRQQSGGEASQTEDTEEKWRPERREHHESLSDFLL